MFAAAVVDPREVGHHMLAASAKVDVEAAEAETTT
eukprot:CAMPEP_0177534494 /NCGR_PEP_ID=MMETSP0369-20130122/55988_1 /TAXON_ID=447022 ORGANISM="Scrippsiella hangoei-like, Strain SHHI-4" /NCGR_SAMPLE_ID=MMETSP0369 /ASSEMBLY_ACC=CAM_ASM_000364 /LENGTH=34 /DNA_ID= /DNA_START= /DNA_END= /DNA_ORIENTATION=